MYWSKQEQTWVNDIVLGYSNTDILDAAKIITTLVLVVHAPEQTRDSSVAPPHPGQYTHQHNPIEVWL